MSELLYFLLSCAMQTYDLFAILPQKFDATSYTAHSTFIFKH